MKKKGVFLVFLVALSVLFSCSKDKDMHFGVSSPLTVEVGAEATQVQIRIEASSNVSWSVTDWEQWCRPDVGTGTGDRTVVLSILPNNTPFSRTSAVMVGSLLGQVRMTITQRGTPASASGVVDDAADAENLKIEQNQQ